MQWKLGTRSFLWVDTAETWFTRVSAEVKNSWTYIFIAASVILAWCLNICASQAIPPHFAIAKCSLPCSKQPVTCVISGIGRHVDEICTLLGY